MNATKAAPTQPKGFRSWICRSLWAEKEARRAAPPRSNLVRGASGMISLSRSISKRLVYQKAATVPPNPVPITIASNGITKSSLSEMA